MIFDIIVSNSTIYFAASCEVIGRQRVYYLVVDFKENLREHILGRIENGMFIGRR